MGIVYLTLLSDYKILFIAGFSMFGLSVVLPSIPLDSGAHDLCFRTMLCTNGNTPWGIVTSIFLYDGWMNVPAFFFVLVAYVSFGDRVEATERRRRARFALAISFMAAILANALWVAILPKTFSWGQSGVVYALWGVLLPFTLFDGLPRHPSAMDPRTWYEDRKTRSSAMSNLAVFSSTAALIFAEPATFLSAGPNVNVFAHAVSFLGGFLAAYVYWLLVGSHSGRSAVRVDRTSAQSRSQARRFWLTITKQVREATRFYPSPVRLKYAPKILSQ